MAEKLSLWFDKKGDFLEFSIDSSKKGFFKDVGNDIFERVDKKGNILGFAIFNFTKRTKFKEEKIKLPVQFKLLSTSA